MDVLQTVAATATILAALVAIATLLFTWRQAREATRPYVVVDLVPTPVNTREAELVVRNYGRTAARNLKVTFSPDLSASESAVDTQLGTLVAQRYKGRAVASLAPGRRLSNIYWQVEGETNANRLGLPARVTATATYEGPKGFKLRKAPQYEDTFALDMDVVRGGTQSTRSTKGSKVDRIAVATEAIARLMS